MKVAADQVGGRRKLRDLLGASSADLAAWISGVAEPPDGVFLRAVELILERLDARDAASKG
jgi:DNA-binding transcriptional regulator YdaS (Cro superfamily)